MLFGIARHTKTELLARRLNRRTVDKSAFIKQVDLTYQFCGMSIPPRRSLKSGILLSLVATQHKNILDAEKLQVKKHVLNILPRKTTAQHVWHNLHAVPLHDGTRHSNGTRTPAQTMTQKRTVSLFLIHILTPMVRDVDVFRTKLLQRVNRTKQTLSASPLKRRQNLKRKSRLLRLIYKFRNSHTILFSQSANRAISKHRQTTVHRHKYIIMQR